MVKSAAEVWQTALGELQLQVARANYQTWLKDTKGLSFRNGEFVVGVPSIFAAEWLDKRLSSLVKKTLISITGRELQVCFQVDGAEPDLEIAASTDKSSKELASTEHSYSPPRLNPRYTFDTFVVGSSNRLAHAAALGVAETPGSAYNPLFIYGGVGLGKTHLLHAIGRVTLDSGLRLRYVSAEQFTNEFINAIREKRTEDFRNKYRSADILLIDDIQFISGKEQTQEGFFHTFNNLHESNRQIVLTSDRPPKSMPLLEDRLRSRFEWGLLADIQPPDLETRIAILRAKAEEWAKIEKQDVQVSQNVLEFIARRVQQNIRELEGSLNRVIAFSKLNRVEITPELAAQALEEIIGQHSTNNITPQKVIETVAQYFKLTPEDLRGKKRDQQTALARQVTMYLVRQETHCPLDGIGQELGGRDHSTVIHACEKIAYEVNTNPARRRQVQDIRGQLYPTASSPF